MPPADPSLTLVNPYAHRGEPDTPSGRSVRAAARVLAVGALGLGAVTVLAGTAAADEGDDAAAAEVAADASAGESGDSGEASPESTDDTSGETSEEPSGESSGEPSDEAGAGSGGGDEPADEDGSASDEVDEAQGEGGRADQPTDGSDGSTGAASDEGDGSVGTEADEGDGSTGAASDEGDGSVQTEGDEADDQGDGPVEAVSDDVEATGAAAEEGDGSAGTASDEPDGSADAGEGPTGEPTGEGVAGAEAGSGGADPSVGEAAQEDARDGSAPGGQRVLVDAGDRSASSPGDLDEEPAGSGVDGEVDGEFRTASAVPEQEPDGDGDARGDDSAPAEFRVDEDVWTQTTDLDALGFAPDAVFERSSAAEDDLVRAAGELVDLFGDGAVEIEGFGTVEIAPLTEALRDVEVRDTTGEPVRVGDVVDRFRPDAEVVRDRPVVELSREVRDAIDAERGRAEAGDPDARIDATVGTPPSVRVAPGVTITGPRVDTGAARFDVDLDEGRIGVTGLGSDLGRITVQGSGTAPLDDRGEARAQGTTSTTVTLDPRTGQSLHLSGAPAGGDRAEAPGSVALRTSNLGTLSTGALPPAARPAGDGSARWGALGVSGGLEGSGALTNGTDSVVASGTVATPFSVFARAGEDDPGSRWDADLTGTVTPQVTFGPTGSDTQVTTDVTGRLGGEVGDRRTAAGTFAGDTDGDGRGAGAVVSGGVSGRYTATDSGLLAVPGTTQRTDADTTQYRVGGDIGFELREDQPTFEAGLEGSLAAGVQGSSVSTAAGSSSTGPSPFVNARLAGDAEVATAPRGEDRAYARVDGSARYDLADGRSSSSLQVTPRVGGEIGLGGTTTLGGSVGYQLGVTDDPTLGSRDDSGPVAGVTTGFNAFGGRSQVGLQYDGADPGGGESVAVTLGFTPGAARETPQPAAEPDAVAPGSGLPRFDAGSVRVADAPVLTPFPGAVTAPVAAVTPEVREPGPLVEGASALSGTTAVGIDLVPTPPVAAPAPVAPQIAPPAAGDLVVPNGTAPATGPAPLDPGGSASSDGLAVPLDRPVIDIPQVEPAPQAAAPVVPPLDAPDGDSALAVSLTEPLVDIPTAEPTTGPGAEALAVPLTAPVVDIPVVAPQPPIAPVEVASVEVAPVPLPEPEPLPAPVPLPEPVPLPAPEPLPLPAPEPLPPLDLAPSPAFAMDDLAGFDSSVSIPTDTFSLSDTSFLDSGSFGFSGGSLF